MVRRNQLDESPQRSAKARREPARSAPVIAIASGKGGTGKTFLATNLAVTAAEERRRALVVDCDFGLADAHLLLGVTPSVTWPSVADGRADAADVVTPTPFGVDLVAGGHGVDESSQVQHGGLDWLRDALTGWRRHYDLILLDVGAGLTTTTSSTLQLADAIVVVTLPELPAMTDAYAVLKCISRRMPEIASRLVVNRVEDLEAGYRTWRKIDSVARQFLGHGVEHLGSVAEAENAGRRRIDELPFVLRELESATALDIAVLLDDLVTLFEPDRDILDDIRPADPVVDA